MEFLRVGVALAAILGAFAPLEAGQPWDSPFVSDTQAIVSAASRITADEHSEITTLLEDRQYKIHSDGRIDRTIRKIFRIDQQDAVEDWSAIQQNYQPWYQQKPEFKARVIGKDGAIRWLETNTIADAPAQQLDANIFSDDRVLRAPLPGVAPGSIVEWQIVVNDKAPLLDAGVTERVVIPTGLRIGRFHFTVEAETGIHLETATQLIPESAMHRSENAQGTAIECDLGPLVPKKHYEWNLPSDVSENPYFAFSTGKSWQAIAERYAKVVDERSGGAGLKKLIEGIDLRAEPKEIAAKLVARLHKDVRYTGVEFGESAIIPNSPEETVARGFGDCKDKATLLVAMLRAAGLKADIALLNAEEGLDVDKSLPGMGMFNHAIVYVASAPPLWIDATASETRVGFLPPDDQGRLALIANRDTRELVKTPESESRDNWQHMKIDVQMSDEGPGKIRISDELNGGNLEATGRATYGDEKKSKERLENWAKRGFAAKGLGQYKVTPQDDMSGSFLITFEAIDSRLSVTGSDDAGVALTPWTIFESLPWALVNPQKDDSDAQPRQHDFVFPDPYRMEMDYIIHPPALFKLAKLPADAQVSFGPTILSKHFESKPDGSVEVVYRYDSGKRRITAAQYEAFQEAYKQHGGRTPELISFVPETTEFVALGQTTKAVSLLRERIAGDPTNAMLHLRFSNVLVNSGLGDAALAEAKRAADLDSKSAYVWANLGIMFEHDSFGRLRQGNWNSDEAEKALRKAIELDPANDQIRTELAILLEYNEQGWRYGPGARMADAIALYQEVIKNPQHLVGIEQNLAVTLLRTQKLEAAREILDKMSGETAELLKDAIKVIQDGPAPVIVAAQASYPDPKQRAMHLASLSQTLLQLRQYAGASATMNAAARLVSAPEVQTRAELLAKVKRWNDMVLPETDPGWPVQTFLLDAFRGSITADSIKPLLSKHLTGELTALNLQDVRSAVSRAKQGLASTGLEEETLVDFILSLLELDKTGSDATGYRIRAMYPGTAATMSLYVIREDGKYRILAESPNGMEGVGALVLDLLEKKDVKNAQWWLDQAVRDAEPRSDGTGNPAVRGLWSGVSEAMRGPSAIRLAATALVGGSTGSPKALAMLEEARAKSANATEKSQIDLAICETLVAAKRWSDLMTAAKRLETSKIFHEEGFRYFVKGATASKAWKPLETEALSAFASNQQHLPAMHQLLLASARLGDKSAANIWLKKIREAPLAGRDDQIFTAWFELAQGQATQQMLDGFKKAKREGDSDKAYQLTLAFIEAKLGMADEAQSGLSRAISGEDLDTIPSVAWAIHGNICGQYGFNECAASSLEKARAAIPRKSDEDWTLWLDQAIGR